MIRMRCEAWQGRGRTRAGDIEEEGGWTGRKRKRKGGWGVD